MKFDPDDRDTLRRILSTYLPADRLELIVDKAGLDLASLSLDGSLASRWQSALKEAERQGPVIVSKLLSAALAHAPDARAEIDTILARYPDLSSRAPLESGGEHGTITVLVLTANPTGTSPLRLSEEIREIQEGLKRVSQRERFKLEQKWAIRPRDLSRALLEVRPQIVHFSGHGTGEAGLVFENDSGTVQRVGAEALAGLFELCRDHVKCVVLNACLSEVQAEAISRHIDYVVGMSQEIGDEAAIAFAIGFYDALGAGKPYEDAFKFGRSGIELSGVPGHLIPVLKKRHDVTPNVSPDEFPITCRETRAKLPQHSASMPSAPSLPLPKSSPALTLLHVSDLHFGQARGDGAAHFDQERIVADLITDVRKMQSKLGPPDHILVTGDIAFSAEKEQYQRAGAWLEKLAGAAGTDRSRIWVVPGNHDVDRIHAMKPLTAKTAHRALRLNPADLDDYLLPENVSELETTLWPKLQAYADFSARWASPAVSPSSPWWRLQLRSSLGPLVLVGLNTCFLSCDGADAATNLALGMGQLHAAFQDLPDDVLVLTLTHHPPEWLTDGPELLRYLQKHPHMLFSGHVHRQGGGVALPFDQRGRVHFTAGAVHGSTQEGDRHGYTWIQVLPAGINYFPRSWSTHWSEFRPDHGHYDLENDVHRVERVTLPKSLKEWIEAAEPKLIPAPPTAPVQTPPPPSEEPAAPPSTARGAAPISEMTAVPPTPAMENARVPPTPFVPDAWRKHIVAVYGHLDPLVDTDRPRRPRIEDLYVPLSARWQSPAELVALRRSQDMPRLANGASSRSEEAAPDGLDTFEEMVLQNVPLPLADLLTHVEVRHFILEGNPGSGKSTFARHATVTSVAAHTLAIYLEVKDFGEWLSRYPEADDDTCVIKWIGDKHGGKGLNASALESRLGFGRTLWLFDGLDEIFQLEVRFRAIRLLGRFFADERMRSERVVVLTRPHAIADPAVVRELGLLTGHARVENLSDHERMTFIERWFGALYPPEEEDCKEKVGREARALFDALLGHPYMSELQGTPLHLGIMATLYFYKRKLPDRRAELFEQTVKRLLERRFGPLVPGGSEGKLIKIRFALEHVARQMMEIGAVRTLGEAEFRRHLEEGWSTEAKQRVAQRIEVQQLCHDLGSHSGLLTVSGYPPEYSFAHLGFQEYLAACAIGEEPEPIHLLEKHLDDGAWQEAILLTAGYMGTDKRPHRLQELLEGLLDRRGNPPDLCRRLALAVQGACEAPRGLLPKRWLEPLSDLAVSALSDPFQPCPWPDRVALGMALGRLGDPRVGLDLYGRWVEIPAGRFEMGSRVSGHSYHRHAHEVRFENPFRIGRYPITNGEYRLFLEAQGYQTCTWWSEGGWRFREKNDLTAPGGWRDATWNNPSQPVAGVSWWEAEAFCAWLTAYLGERSLDWFPPGSLARLPSEAEWEYVARGRDEQREYPWGKEAPAAERACYRSEPGSPGRTTPVGVFPSGASRDVIYDLAGNVWEWCGDAWHDNYKGAPNDGATWIENGARDRVVRGGSWGGTAGGLWTAIRGHVRSTYRNQDVGFRVVLSDVPVRSP